MRWQSQADITGDQPISLAIFILLINGRIGHEDQQWPHNRVNLKCTVIFLAPHVHMDLLLADITFTPHNPTLNRNLTWLGDFNLIRHTVESSYNPPCYKPTSATVYSIQNPIHRCPLTDVKEKRGRNAFLKFIILCETYAYCSLLKWDCLPDRHAALCASPDPSVCLLRARLW